MGQVSREFNPDPSNGGLGYNFGDYIKQKSLCGKSKEEDSLL